MRLGRTRLAPPSPGTFARAVARSTLAAVVAAAACRGPGPSPAPAPTPVEIGSIPTAPGRASAIAIGPDRIYVTMDRAGTWQLAHYGLAELPGTPEEETIPWGQKLTAVAVSPGPPPELYLGTEEQLIVSALTPRGFPDGARVVPVPGGVREVHPSATGVRVSGPGGEQAVPSAAATAPRSSTTPPAAGSFPATPVGAVRGPLAAHFHQNRITLTDRMLPWRFRDRNGDGVLTLACVGDSNTVRGEEFPRWCGRLARITRHRGLEVLNTAVAGATAVATRTPPGGAGAAAQIERVLRAPVDAAVIQFGSNDLNLRNAARPRDVIAAYRRIRDELTAAGIRVFFATTPQRGPDPWKAIATLNRLLYLHFGSADVLDLSTMVTAAHMQTDGLHIGPAGQERRAWAAYAQLVCETHDDCAEDR